MNQPDCEKQFHVWNASPFDSLKQQKDKGSMDVCAVILPITTTLKKETNVDSDPSALLKLKANFLLL